jgi:hypothetical protein
LPPMICITYLYYKTRPKGHFLEGDVFCFLLTRKPFLRFWRREPFLPFWREKGTVYRIQRKTLSPSSLIQ